MQNNTDIMYISSFVGTIAVMVLYVATITRRQIEKLVETIMQQETKTLGVDSMDNVVQFPVRTITEKQCDRCRLIVVNVPLITNCPDCEGTMHRIREEELLYK